jgi:predicted SAM-dependent methyltransferase
MRNFLLKFKIFLIKIKLAFIKFGWRIRRNIIKPKLPKNEDGKVYVNLGCGRHTSKEYINVDTVIMPHMHYLNDISELIMFPDNSVDLLYAAHVLEHIPRSKLKKTLQEWYRVLKSGGIFRFGVPDFDKLIEVYEGNNKDVNSILYQVMGSEGEYDDHHTIWNFTYAEKILKEAGFKEVGYWDYKTADHHEFNDKTSRIMPAGGKSILISLNLEAIK